MKIAIAIIALFLAGFGHAAPSADSTSEKLPPKVSVVPQSLDGVEVAGIVGDIGVETASIPQPEIPTLGENVAPEPTAIPPVPIQSESTDKGAAKDSPALKESEIPVLTGAKEQKATVENPMSRVIMSFIVIAIAALGLVAFSRWYTKKGVKSSDSNRIRVLNQHFLGPKKSIAIIRVAGESFLVGITDHNISLLKTLSLLDEEIPETTPARFETALSSADRAADSGIVKSKTKGSVKSATDAELEQDEFFLGNIKDRVSAKIKNMRNI